MDRQNQINLLSRMAKLAEASESQAIALLDEISDSRLQTRAEAETVLRINRQIDKALPDWDVRFRWLLKDFLLTAEAPIGWLDAQECSWLMSQLPQSEDRSKLNEIDLLLDILPHAEGSPRQLAKFAFQAIATQARGIGRISPALLERLRALLIAPMGETSVWITKWEAAGLLALNQDVGAARNDPGWCDLYSRAITNHLMARSHPSPEDMVDALDRRKWLNTQTSTELGGIYLTSIQAVDETRWFQRCASTTARASSAQKAACDIALQATGTADGDDWLMRRLGWSDTLNAADRALIDFLRTQTPGFALGLALAMRPAYSRSEMASS